MERRPCPHPKRIRHTGVKREDTMLKRQKDRDRQMQAEPAQSHVHSLWADA